MQCTRHKSFKWSSYITHSLRFHSCNHHDCSPYLNICLLRCNKSPARPWLTASEQAEICRTFSSPPVTRAERGPKEVNPIHLAVSIFCSFGIPLMDPYMGKMLFTDPNDNDTLTAIIIKSLPIKTLHFICFVFNMPKGEKATEFKQKRSQMNHPRKTSNASSSPIVSKSNLRLYAEYMFAVKPA